MARRRPSARPRPTPKPEPVAVESPEVEADSRPFWTAPRLALAVATLLTLHATLAVRSLLVENPTVDEVVHLPAGVTYWQSGTFRLYPHNPPLVKLVAAWPVVQSRPEMEAIYRSSYWARANKTGVAHLFTEANAERYFELFAGARLLMPAFSVIGGLAVFAWARQLYGAWGGLLSLSLWCLCPNILAHARLVTSDVAATALGFMATYLFWRYLHRPTWTRAALAGLALGLAELAKFSMLLLYGLWPVLWLIHQAGHPRPTGLARHVGRAVLHGLMIVTLSVLVIDAGYGFERVGEPLGKFPFVSASLTRPRDRPMFQVPRPGPGDLLNRIREYRVNRFHGTALAGLPAPLPWYYLTGFDEQKLEADGVWTRFLIDPARLGDQLPPEEADVIHSYPVYLDGELRQKSWWYYYLLTLCYKVPEGTWALVLLGLVVMAVSRRSRAPWADEAAVLLVPAVVLGVMSFLTNINLGLRYVLPVFPYVYVSTGKLAPWAAGPAGWRRRLSVVGMGACLAMTAAALAAIHPHYLAYFNWASGGPANGSKHLIDSNLDWGQDLVGLRRWVAENAPDEPIGLAYFGQINPNIFAARGEPLDWFLPPPRPRTMDPLPPGRPGYSPARPPRPGLYAVSASLVRGLDWRVYDRVGPAYWPAGRDAFSYFRDLTPFDNIGHSIFLYRVTEADAARLARLWDKAR